MAKDENYRCSFNVEGTIPKPVFEAFALAQAQLTGVRIRLEEDAENEIRGFLEGNKETVEKMRAILLKSIETLGNIKKIIFTEMIALKDFTEKTLDKTTTPNRKTTESNVTEPEQKS